MLKRFALTATLLITIIVLAACAADAQTMSLEANDELVKVELKNSGPAPELQNTIWLNTAGQTLRLADLRGQVVAIDFWTFG